MTDPAGAGIYIYANIKGIFLDGIHGAPYMQHPPSCWEDGAWRQLSFPKCQGIRWLGSVPFLYKKSWGKYEGNPPNPS